MRHLLPLLSRRCGISRISISSISWWNFLFSFLGLEVIDYLRLDLWKWVCQFCVCWSIRLHSHRVRDDKCVSHVYSSFLLHLYRARQDKYEFCVCWSFHLHANRAIQGWKKYFDRGVLPYFQIELIMNFISNESPWKMGFSGIFSADKTWG